MGMTNSLKLAPVQPTSSPSVVASAAYAEGRRVADIALDKAGEWSRKPGHVVWIGLHEPGLDLLRQLQAEFSLHELAIEDADATAQTPHAVRIHIASTKNLAAQFGNDIGA